MTTYTPFPTRTVEDSFGAHQLDDVTERFWKYLSKKDGDTTLRTTHYLDIMNLGNTLSYREPYFIMADVSDYADYSNTYSSGSWEYRYPSYSSNIGRIYWSAGSLPRTTIRLVLTPPPQIYSLHQTTNDIYELKLSTIEGINSGTFTVDYTSGKQVFIKNTTFSTGNPAEVPSSGSNYIQDNIKALMYDKLQGNQLTSPQTLSGRGTISINLDFENVENIMYKVTINTLPIFIDWATMVVRYLTQGSFNPIVDVTL